MEILRSEDKESELDNLNSEYCKGLYEIKNKLKNLALETRLAEHAQHSVLRN